jgi:hypothetical protein
MLLSASMRTTNGFRRKRSCREGIILFDTIYPYK